MRLPQTAMRREDDRHSARSSETSRRLELTSQAPKVAIITGSSRGIGASIAKRLATDGMTVIVNYAGREADAKQVVEDITS